MKTNKKGISLIVLVITIIVIIILAAAVILTINNNNPMDNANKAKYSSDRATMQQALTTTIGTIMGEELTTPKFYDDKGYTNAIGGYQKILNDLVFCKAGTKNCVIAFSSTAPKSDDPNLPAASLNAKVYLTGYALPKYGTGAGSGTWYINAAGDLQLEVGDLTFNGSMNGK